MPCRKTAGNCVLADQLFVQNQVSVKFKGEMAKKDSPYCIVFCKVRKRDSVKFEEALGRLENKMILCGHREYAGACDEVEKMVEERLQSILQKV